MLSIVESPSPDSQENVSNVNIGDDVEQIRDMYVAVRVEALIDL